MKRLFLATMIASTFITSSAFASRGEVNACIREVEQNCAESSSFIRELRSKAADCDTLDNQSGDHVYAVFKGRQGGLLMVGVGAGARENKCQASTFDVQSIFRTSIAVAHIEESGNKMWVRTEQGNILFIRMAIGSGAPELYALENANHKPYSSCTNVSVESKNVVRLDFNSRDSIRVNQSKIQSEWIEAGRAVKAQTNSRSVTGSFTLGWFFN